MEEKGAESDQANLVSIFYFFHKNYKITFSLFMKCWLEVYIFAHFAISKDEKKVPQRVWGQDEISSILSKNNLRDEFKNTFTFTQTRIKHNFNISDC